MDNIPKIKKDEPVILDQHGQNINKNDKIKEKDEKEIKEDAKVKAKKILEESLKKAAVIDIEELAEAESKKAADAYMTESKANMKGFVGFFKKIWKHTYADEFYRQRQAKRAEKEIKESGNIYSNRKDENNKNIDKSAHEGAMKGITDRFSSEYDEMLSKGENKDVLKDDQTKNDIKKLISDYANKTIDENTFNKQKDALVKNIGEKNHMQTDNFLEIAQNARVAVEHGVKMEELDLDFNIIVGKAKSSLKTEAHFNKIDKLIDGMKKTKIGRYISPAVLSTAVGIGYCIAINSSKRLASSKAAAIITLGGSALVAGAFAGVNESQRVAREREQHALDMAEGGVAEKGDKRREQLEKYQYQMVNSNDLASGVRSSLFEKDADGKDVMKANLTEEEIKNAFGSLADIYARRSLNEEKRADLISYSKFENVEKERTELEILTTKAKVELRKRIEGGLQSGLPKGETFDSYLEKQIEAAKGALLGGEKGMNQADKAFSGYKTKRAVKKAFTAVGVGLVFGATIQEVGATLSEHSEGIAEGMLGHHNPNAVTQTPLEYVRGIISGNPTHITGNVAESIGGHNFTLPEGTSLTENSDGTFNIVRGDNIISDHIPLHFNANGSLDKDSMELLGEDGIVGNTTPAVINSTKTITINPEDYAKTHPDALTEIARTKGAESNGPWMANDTPMHPDPENPGHMLGADKNELRTYWGGENGTGIAENGHYQMKIDMTNEGSFEGDTSVSANDEMEKGNLVALLSISKGDQTHVFQIPITKEGIMDVAPDSDAGKMLFDNVNGHANYDGAFIEIAKPNGFTADGREIVQILGTHIGSDSANSITDIVETHEDIATNHLGLPLKTEMPYFVPVLSRMPLEPLSTKKKEVNKTEENSGEGHGNGETAEKLMPSIQSTPVSEIEKQKLGKEISKEEYDAMANDMKMLNKKRQSQDGIITITEADFKSKYGKDRYNQLKNIADEKPVTFNHEELLVIGDEIDTILTNSKIKKELPPLTEKEISNRAYEIYEKRQKNGEAGDEKSDWEQAKKELEAERVKQNPESAKMAQLKKDLIEAVRMDEDNRIREIREKIARLQNSEENLNKDIPTEDAKSNILESSSNDNSASNGKIDVDVSTAKNTNKFTPEESIYQNSNFVLKDLFKKGTEFYDESKYYIVKKGSGWFGKNIEVETINKKTGEKTTNTWNKKNLKYQFEQRKLNINKVEGK